MTNNKQQTPVDILCGKLAMKLGIPQAITFYIDHQEEIKEAKEMEKEQMIEFGELVWKNLLRSDKIMKSRDVYNETYGGNK
jgi:hypothetical protein